MEANRAWWSGPRDRPGRDGSSGPTGLLILCVGSAIAGLGVLFAVLAVGKDEGDGTITGADVLVAIGPALVTGGVLSAVVGFAEHRIEQARDLKEEDRKQREQRSKKHEVLEAAESLEYRDLADEDLTGISLPGRDLRNANLRRAVLRDADLRYANLAGADLTGADLTGARCKGAVFHRTVCRGTHFDKADLWLADFRKLSPTDEADRSGSGPGAQSSPPRQYVDGIRNPAALKAPDPELRRNAIDERLLVETFLDATAGPLEGATFSEASLQGTIFDGVRLKDVDFTKARLVSTRFFECAFVGQVNFSEATLRAAQFGRATWEKMDDVRLTFGGAKYEAYNSKEWLEGLPTEIRPDAEQQSDEPSA